MFDFTATPSRPAKSPGDVAATSPRPTETRVANRSPTSLHASEIGALESRHILKENTVAYERDGYDLYTIRSLCVLKGCDFLYMMQ